jgi:nitrogen regulatory protein PII
MKMLIYVMNRPELLDKFLKELAKNQIKGGTIIDSTGMGRRLAGNDDIPWIGSLRAVFDMPRAESKTILLVLPDEQVDVVYGIINTISGDLSKPNTGIAFTLPIDSVKGYKG